MIPYKFHQDVSSSVSVKIVDVCVQPDGNILFTPSQYEYLFQEFNDDNVDDDNEWENEIIMLLSDLLVKQEALKGPRNKPM